MSRRCSSSAVLAITSTSPIPSSAWRATTRRTPPHGRRRSPSLTRQGAPPHAGERFGTFRRRIPDPRSIDASKGRQEAKVAADGVRAIRFGVHEIDLSAVSQVVDPAQTAAIARAILRAKCLMDGRTSLQEAVEAVVAETESRGLDALVPYPSGGLAAFRPFELAAAINRLRTLRVGQKE